MTRFNRCPNCGHYPSGGLLGGTHFDIFECRDCGTCYCYKCGDKRCPDCASRKRGKAGTCWGPPKG